jgi:5,10-methenyltetrahydrofolate synthetase
MNDWREWRKQRRTELVALREAIPEADSQHWNSMISESLKQGFPELQSMVVGFCWPHRGEYDPRPYMKFLHESGATLAFPEVVSRFEPLRFRKWWPGAPMKTGAYGIPIPENEVFVEIGAAVIPMIGFDKRGFRLGYGGGFFDRTLAGASPRPLAIGVAFEILAMDNVHPQSHDIPMDFIVTEAGIYRTMETGLERISGWAAPAGNRGTSQETG